MQYDMHYYGIYALAYAAGIPKPDAELIAQASQAVDDQCMETFQQLPSGEAILGIATAHHPLNAGERVLSHIANDSRLVWVPFHFFPGNSGATFEEKLVTRKNSALINSLLDFYLSNATIEANRSNILELLGIALHVYADTFSHAGFAGISSPLNHVEADSIAFDCETIPPSHLELLSHPLDTLKSELANLPALGHGGVLTYPDLPYLRWSYIDSNQQKVERDNPTDYLDACAFIYDRLIDFAHLYYQSAYQPLAPWRDLKVSLQPLIQHVGDLPNREAAWLEAFRLNQISGVSEAPHPYQPGQWTEQMSELIRQGDSKQLRESSQYRFICAAYYHRDFVLRNFLPMRELMIA